MDKKGGNDCNHVGALNYIFDLLEISRKGLVLCGVFYQFEYYFVSLFFWHDFMQIIQVKRDNLNRKICYMMDVVPNYSHCFFNSIERNYREDLI
jgi:hypothetical protein